MCGIVGHFLPVRARPGPASLEAALARLDHRGPDAQRTYKAPNGLYDCGFARLAIIDVATGQQPLLSPDGRLVLMGNGEIYNYLELRQRLIDYPFRTDGDMEVVLALAQADPANFVAPLNGMFALALYDAAAHRLVLVRDRLGIKPVYWARCRQGGIVFASEPKAIFATGLLDPAVADRSVAAFLAHGYVPAPDTLYKGIFKLPPGHLMTVGPEGSPRVERYWQPARVDLPRDAGEIEAYVLALMEDSVRLQMRSDVPVGALLSGGLDSGMIVALGARTRSDPLNTYTVSFEGAPVDEAPLAAEVASRYGTRHTRFELSAGSLLEHFPNLVWHCDDPISDASLLPNYLIEQALSREVRVALNGTGGDELFAGYGRYFQNSTEARYLRLPAWARQSVLEPAVALVDPMTAWKLGRARKFLTDPAGYVHEHATLFPAPMRRLIGATAGVVPYAQRRWTADGPPDSQAVMLSAELGTYLVDNLLTLLDRTSMAWSVEGRVPLLDHRLVEAMLSVPQAIRTPSGQQKGLLRRIARNLLPGSVLSARKQGFASPVDAWLQGEMLQASHELLAGKRALERGWWTREGIGRLFADPGPNAHRIYALMVLELTAAIHVDRTVPPTGTFLDYVEG